MEEENVQGAPQSTRKPIVWSAHEHAHFERDNEWFWILGLIGVAAAVISIIFNNILFAILILIATFVLALFAVQKPQEVEFAVTQRGVRINNELLAYKTLESFGIEEFSPHHSPKLILSSKKPLVLDVIIPLENVDIDEVHDFLLDFLPEEDHEEPLTHKLFGWFGL